MWNSICNWHLTTLRSFGLSWAHKSQSEVLQGNKMCMSLCQYTPAFKKLCFSQWRHINCNNILVGKDSLDPRQVLLLTSRQNFSPQSKGCCLRYPEIQETPLRAQMTSSSPTSHPNHPLIKLWWSSSDRRSQKDRRIFWQSAGPGRLFTRRGVKIWCSWSEQSRDAHLCLLCARWASQAAS